MHTPPPSIQFPLGTEGPFYRLQLALRLAAEDRPNVIRRAAAMLGITWLPLALLWIIQGVPEASGADHLPAESLFTHVATYARFFVTVPLLIVAENAVRPLLESTLQQAVIREVVPPARQGAFFELLLAALEWRKSRRAEAVMLCLAYLAAHLAMAILVTEQHASWMHGGGRLTWAGAWYAYISLPLLQFLIFRWLYRLIIWWRVLYRMSRLGLNIQPAHPDGRGGLAFIGDSIQAFGILAFAFGATASGAVADFIFNESAPLTELKGFIAGAAIFILLLFIGPLGFFIKPLYEAKDEALLRYEGLAEKFWQAFDRKWLEAPLARPTADQIAQSDFSALDDLGSVVKAVREMKTFPLTHDGLLPLVLAIAIPFLPILLVAFPVQELLSGVLHVFMGRAE